MIIFNKKYIAFFIGLFSYTQVRVVGTFAISEIIIFIFTIYFLLTNPIPIQRMFKSKRMLSLLILCILWILSIFFSDQINESVTLMSIKGIGAVIPLFFIFIFFYWLLYDNLSVMQFFLWGTAISFFISLFIFTNTALQYVVDSSGAESLSETSIFDRLIVGVWGRLISAFSFQYFSTHPVFVIILQAFAAFYALFEGSRAPFLVGIITVLILIYFKKYSKANVLNIKIISFIRRRIPFLITLIVIGFFLAMNIYSFVAERGYLGEANMRKYERQSKSKLGLLSGRGEFVSAYLAISDAPILGHGSYAKDEDGYAVAAAQITGDTEYLDYLIDNVGEEYIPTHSHLSGAWVQNGVLGAVFWIYCLFILIKYLLRYIYIIPKWIAYTLPAVFSMIWQILFSPFAYRVTTGFFLVFIILMMDQIDKSKKNTHSAAKKNIE